MDLAIQEARCAFDEDEVPVGAVIVKDGILLGRGHNLMRKLCDPTAHAEIIAITAACEKINQPRLQGADIFVTLEPCSMCAGALVLARIKRLYFAVYDDKTGACGSVFDIVREPRLNHIIEVYSGLEEDRCKALMEEFFKTKRV